MGRHAVPPKPADRKRLLSLIRQHDGVVSSMAKAVKPRITHQAMHQRLQRHGLVDEAAMARGKAQIPGKRGSLGPEAFYTPKERATIVRMRKLDKGLAEIAKALGISERGVSRRLEHWRLSA